MKPYSTLTEHGQARRLRPLALNALKKYNLDVARLRLVTNSLNGIFRIDTSDGRKFILRVALPEGGHNLEHVAAEMDWLAALAQETTLSVPRPLPARDGSLVVEAGASGVPEPRLCTIFSWVPGKDLAEEMSPSSSTKLGELTARIHAHALTYLPPTGLSLLKFDRVFPFPDPVVIFDEQFSSLFTQNQHNIYRQAFNWAQAAIDNLISSGEPMHLLHGDLHQWNVRYSRGVLSPIDFEDLMWGWPVQDIATSLYYIIDREDYLPLRAAFRVGYSILRPWPERYPGEIDAFIAARGIGMVNFVLNSPNAALNSQAAEFVERIEKRLRKLMENNRI